MLTLLNKTADMAAKWQDSRIMKVSNNSQQNNSETVANEHGKEILKERYIAPKERQKVIDSLYINMIV